MLSRKKFNSMIALALAASSLLQTVAMAYDTTQSPPDWAYDAGPDLSTGAGMALNQIRNSIPNMPGLSEAVIGKQKFRPVFDAIPWRMLQKRNSIKILFIGQDGTHIAEAAGRPATAGFGGRAQDLAKYFGVSESAAFINAYAFTIKGQARDFNAPMISTGADGKPTVSFGTVIENPLWMLSYDQASPIVKWRNSLIDWIIRNNRDSLRMIVTFGGPAQNSIANYIEAKGGQVGTFKTEADLAKIRVPEIRSVNAGGNNEFPVPVTPEGKDLYAELLGVAKPQYAATKAEQDAQKTAKVQLDAMAALKAKLPELLAKKRLVFPKGTAGSGLVHPAQLGGFSLDKIVVNGKTTRSLKGLMVGGQPLQNDILVVDLPHPTALTMAQQKWEKTHATDPSAKSASDLVSEDLKAIASYSQNGWTIPADPGFTNEYANGKPYAYGRAKMGPEFYDFGAPGSRMVDVSSAVRSGEQAIVFGTRDKGTFDPMLVEQMQKSLPAQLPDASERWRGPSTSPKSLAQFDHGPGEAYAQIMKSNLPLAQILAPKPGMDPKTSGIAAYNVKSGPDNADYAHYRGTFKNPRVVVLADPDGYDDLITARALTGTRGQYLQGLMNGIGVGDQYLVIKTVPFGMDGATSDEWSTVLAQTKTYRAQLFAKLLSENKPELIIADGRYAQAAIQDALNGVSGAKQIPLVRIDRNELATGGATDSGLAKATQEIAAKVPALTFKAAASNIGGGTASGVPMANIPRTHLSYYARLWEGTSGDRVITSNDEFRGTAFIVVVPDWAAKQKVELKPNERQGADALLNKMREKGLRLPDESVSDFVKRISGSTTAMVRDVIAKLLAKLTA